MVLNHTLECNVNYDSECKSDRIIYGRDTEIETLVKHFDNVLDGEFAMCLLRGEAGVGKTYLVSNMVQELLDVEVTYIYGKVNHYNHSFFSVMNEVLDSMISNVLTLSDEKLERIKVSLNRELQDAKHLITSLCPMAEKLLGHYKSIREEDYHKLEYRFHNAIYIFMNIMSQALFPMVLHLDDLHWAGQDIKRFIKYWGSRDVGLNLFLVMSMRESNIIDFSTAFGKKGVLSMELSRLSLVEAEAYFRSLIHKSVILPHCIGDSVYRATLGNPFYIKQLSDNICNKSVISESFFDQFQLPDNVKKKMVDQIEVLSDEQIAMLQLLACLGGRSDHVLIRRILGDKTNEGFLVLDELCETGLIYNVVQTTNDEVTVFQFTHDIFYEMILISMNSDEKTMKHFTIANKLIDLENKIYLDENRLFVAAQLMSCREILLEQSDCSKYILELYFAGIKAKQSTQIEDAVTYLTLCLQLMLSNQSSISLTFNKSAHFELAECLYLSGDIEKSEREYEYLIKTYNSNEDLVILKHKFMLLYTYDGEYDKVLKLGYETLKHLSFDISINNIKLSLIIEILKCKMMMTDKKITELKSMPYIKDDRLLAIQNTLIRMAAIANLVNEDLFALLITRLSNVAARYGNSKFSPPAYAACSFIMYHFLNDKKKAVILCQNVHYLLEDDEEMNCMTWFILGTFVEHWEKSIDQSLKSLYKSINVGVKSGEFQYAGYSFSTMFEMRYFKGESIELLMKICKNISNYDQRLNHEVTKTTIALLRNHMSILSDNETLELNADFIDTLDPSQQATYYLYKLQRSFYRQDSNACYQILQILEPMSALFKGYLTEVEYEFVATMVRLKKHMGLKGFDKVKNWLKILKSMRQFKRWMLRHDGNHLTKHIVLSAKYMEVTGNQIRAGELYEQGIVMAQNNNELPVAIVGALAASEFYSERLSIANMYLEKAVKNLSEWGATHYADELRTKVLSYDTSRVLTEDQEDEKDENTDEICKFDDHQFNIANHIEIIEKLSKEQSYKYLLDTLLEVSGATYGSIFMESKDKLYLAYESDQMDEGALEGLTPVENVTRIPHKVIRYVVRTSHEVVLNNRPVDGLFANDTYFLEKPEISLLCYPIKYQDIFAGFIYLQWDEGMCIDKSIIECVKVCRPIIISKIITEEIIEVDKTLKHTPKEIEDIPLTKRELEVFKHLIQGFTNKQIGEQLGIALSTVKTHVISIYSKLEIKNRVAAVETAKRYGLIDNNQ